MTFYDVTWPHGCHIAKFASYYSRMVMTDVIHDIGSHCNGYLWKMSHLIFPPLTYNGRSRNWPDLRPSIKNIKVVGKYGLIISCNLPSAQSSTLALSSDGVSNVQQKVMWGRVIQTDLATWSFKIWGHNLHIMCNKDEGIVMPNFTACSAAVFPLSTKNLRGPISAPPPSVRVLNLYMRL